jgi:3alpha(or 20beta)-hydroxysteroid dehydrogenase
MEPNGPLEGRVALVTGGARGQGEAEARALVAAGARVMICDVRDDAGEVVSADIGSAATYRHLDVTSEQDWEAAVGATVAEFGGLDVLVNNAGILIVKPLVKTTVEDFNRVMGVNQLGTFLGMRSVVEPMTERGGGSIINVSSTGGIRGFSGMVAYNASKFAVRGMTRNAAIELGPLGIRVNAVLPGSVDTPMIAHVDQTDRWNHLPIPRSGQPEEIAAIVVMLASDTSSYMTGADVVVDGGSTAGSM